MRAFNIIYNQIKQWKQEDRDSEHLNVVSLAKAKKEIEEQLK